jgi:serine phosphatase RsbU (regulator of sigma subunit)
VEQTGTTSAREATAGLLYLDSRAGAADLSSGNRELLQTLAIEASTILENARLMEQERQKLRMDDELNIARTIQQDLLPPTLPLSGWFRAAGSSSPATEVGGDYFDVRRITDGRWTVVVADVSGKGVSAALLASLMQGAFLMANGEPDEIAPMLGRWNEFLLERTKGRKYATVFFATVDDSGRLYFSNAGHCTPYLVSTDGRVKRVKESGMPVGLVEGAQFEMHAIELAPGDKLVIYSDGLTEAEDAEGQFFETARLRSFLKDHASLGAEEIHRLLLDVVRRFTEGGVIRDDITVLVLEYHGLNA